jgi:hypothetical protein
VVKNTANRQECPFHWRWWAGGAVVALLAAFAALLAPVYYRSHQFQRELGHLVRQPDSLSLSDELLRTRVLDRAARLGLPVPAEQIRIQRADGHLRIEVRYRAPVELGWYAVDLHFRAGAAR